jgi:hypothetical protein
MQISKDPLNQLFLEKFAFQMNEPVFQLKLDIFGFAENRGFEIVDSFVRKDRLRFRFKSRIPEIREESNQLESLITSTIRKFS